MAYDIISKEKLESLVGIVRETGLMANVHWDESVLSFLISDLSLYREQKVGGEVAEFFFYRDTRAGAGVLTRISPESGLVDRAEVLPLDESFTDLEQFLVANVKLAELFS